MSRRFTRGFTLIELLVVIAIIGILASVVLVSLQSARKKGNDTRVIAGVQQIRTALEANFNANNSYPDLTLVGAPHFFADLPTGNIGTIITDIIAQQNAGGLSGTVAYGVNAAHTASFGANSSVIITKDSSSPAKGYAIYAKLPSSGVAFCMDGTGNTKTTTYPTVEAGAATSITCQP
jgi:prepilin-type N-terminal cleavage/methylation domain-containing protein